MLMCELEPPCDHDKCIVLLVVYVHTSVQRIAMKILHESQSAAPSPHSERKRRFLIVCADEQALLLTV